ncbi:MAG: tagatose 1,6-diphosphate aldolase [Azospirillaceae bacterium]
MALTPGKTWGLRRLSDDGRRFAMVAIDQRPPIRGLIEERLGPGAATFERIGAFKRLLAEHLAPHTTAMLADPYYAYPAAIDRISPRQGLIVTLEDSVFEETAGGRLSKAIDGWSVAKIRRLGGDAVKVLAWYRPDAGAEVVARQQAFVRDIGAACREHDIPFVLELLVYPLPGEAGNGGAYAEDPAKRPAAVVESLETFADPAYGVDLFKLESPVLAADVPEPDSRDAAATQAWFDRLGAACPVPWVMLSAGCPPEAFERVLTYAYRAGASGYLAGRAIWSEAGAAYPDEAAMGRALAGASVDYMRRINALTRHAARPWTDAGGGIRDLRPADAAEPGFNLRYGEARPT